MGVTVSSKKVVKCVWRLASIAALFMIPLSSTLQADDAVLLDGNWTVSKRAIAGGNRCILRSSAKVTEDYMLIGNNGLPHIPPKGAAALGLVLKHTIEDSFQVTYPEKFDGVFVFAPGKGVWETSATWMRSKVGGTAIIQLKIPIEEFIDTIETAEELIITLPLAEPEKSFSLLNASQAISNFRKCLAE